MEKIEGNRSGGNGNTNPPAKEKKQSVQIINWFFTFNNYDLKTDIEILEVKFKEICKKYVFQREIGKCGTHHLQGNIVLKKPMRYTEFKLSTKIHWEKTRNDTAAAEYCKKSETSVKDSTPYIYGYPKPIKIITDLYDWQSEIVALFQTEPDGRSVHWFWDKIGGAGKSSFTKYMFVKYGAITIQGGKLADIMNIMFNLNFDEVKMIMIDIPRNNGNKISYSSIECILNGMITNTKFETGVKVFNAPHVVVFCNFEPEKDKLSEDRWKIKELKHSKIVIEEEVITKDIMYFLK